MPLTWDVTNIKDHERVTTDPNDATKWNPVTFTLVQVAMIVDLGTVDADNIDEWMYRLAYLHVTGRGSHLIETKKKGRKTTVTERTFTRAELEAHIGLRMNVSTMSRKQWLGKQQRILSRLTDSAVTDLFHTTH